MSGSSVVEITRSDARDAVVDDFGGPHAEKSKILHGIAWELMATRGPQKSEEDAAAEKAFPAGHSLDV
jgi:hypothetical protein